MSRLTIIVIAVGGFGIVSALPFASSSAVRAHPAMRLAKAENTCLDYNVGPNSVAFDTCVGRTARAYDRGDPAAAAAEARNVTEARETCLSYDIEQHDDAGLSPMHGQRDQQDRAQQLRGWIRLSPVAISKRERRSAGQLPGRPFSWTESGLNPLPASVLPAGVRARILPGINGLDIHVLGSRP